MSLSCTPELTGWAINHHVRNITGKIWHKTAVMSSHFGYSWLQVKTYLHSHKVKGGCTHEQGSGRVSTHRASFRWICVVDRNPGECRFHHLEMKLLYVYQSSHKEDWSFPDFPFCWDGLTSGEKKSHVCSCRNFYYLYAFIEACKVLRY